MISWFLIHSKYEDKRKEPFLCSLCFGGGYILIFQSFTLPNSAILLSGTVLEHMDMSVSQPSFKFLEIQQLAHSLLQMQPVTICQVMSCFGRANF